MTLRTHIPVYKHGHACRTESALCLVLSLKRSHTMPVKAVEVSANELTEPNENKTEAKLII